MGLQKHEKSERWPGYSVGCTKRPLLGPGCRGIEDAPKSQHKDRYGTHARDMTLLMMIVMAMMMVMYVGDDDDDG